MFWLRIKKINFLVQIKSNGLFKLRAQEGQTIKEEILHTMINDDKTDIHKQQKKHLKKG